MACDDITAVVMFFRFYSDEEFEGIFKVPSPYLGYKRG